MPLLIRPPQPGDFDAWSPLWDGYNAFYGRAGATALDPRITRLTWQRFLDPDEPVFALLAQGEGRMLGIAHFLHHRSTTRLGLSCYLQDLYTEPAARGQGIARALIEAVCDAARGAGIDRVYWQTHESNATARRLYDRVARHAGFIVYTHDGA